MKVSVANGSRGEPRHAPRGHGGAAAGLRAAAGAAARGGAGAHSRGPHGSWGCDCTAAGGAAGAAWAPLSPHPENDGHWLLLCGPCCGQLVQDSGLAHPWEYKSCGCEEGDPGPGGFRSVLPWLLPGCHRGHERAVGAGELVQDPEGLHGCPDDQLLYLATRANCKLLLRASAAQAGCCPMCCHRLELLPVLESESDVRHNLCPVPVPGLCAPDQHNSEPWPWARVAVGRLGYTGSCSSHPALFSGEHHPLWPRPPAPGRRWCQDRPGSAPAMLCSDSARGPLLSLCSAVSKPCTRGAPVLSVTLTFPTAHPEGKEEWKWSRAGRGLAVLWAQNWAHCRLGMLPLKTGFAVALLWTVKASINSRLHF